MFICLFIVFAAIGMLCVYVSLEFRAIQRWGRGNSFPLIEKLWDKYEWILNTRW